LACAEILSRHFRNRVGNPAPSALAATVGDGRCRPLRIVVTGWSPVWSRRSSILGSKLGSAPGGFPLGRARQGFHPVLVELVQRTGVFAAELLHKERTLLRPR